MRSAPLPFLRQPWRCRDADREAGDLDRVEARSCPPKRTESRRVGRDFLRRHGRGAGQRKLQIADAQHDALGVAIGDRRRSDAHPRARGQALLERRRDAAREEAKADRAAGDAASRARRRSTADEDDENADYRHDAVEKPSPPRYDEQFGDPSASWVTFSMSLSGARQILVATGAFPLYTIQTGRAAISFIRPTRLFQRRIVTRG